MVEWLPVGHVLARTPAGSGVIAPATVARAALAPGVAEIGRVVPPGAGAATEARPLAGAEPGVVAEPDVVAERSLVVEPGVGAELGVVAVAPTGAGPAHSAPAAGGEGISNPLSSAVRAGVRAAFGSLPSPSGAACCSSMGPPDRPRADAGGDVGRRP
jgi:hypothetical protein